VGGPSVSFQHLREPENARADIDFLSLLFRTSWIFEVLGLLIAGMGLYKTGFLTAKLSSRRYWAVAAAGYAISVPIVLFGLRHSSKFGFSDAVTTVWMFLPYGNRTDRMHARKRIFDFASREEW
jgi:uncharacterized protein